jgi:hypothetical protein
MFMRVPDHPFDLSGRDLQTPSVVESGRAEGASELSELCAVQIFVRFEVFRRRLEIQNFGS